MDIPAGEAYEFDCVLPLYGGEFRVVVEGIDDYITKVCEYKWPF